MISLDQVLLLEEKVECAVKKIAQLNQENDALRTRCSELTKALSEKTEQLSAFTTDQNKIEEGILKALERLNSVEHSVLKAAALTQQINHPVSAPAVETEHKTDSKQETVSIQETAPSEENPAEEQVIPAEIIPETPDNSSEQSLFETSEEEPLSSDLPEKSSTADTPETPTEKTDSAPEKFDAEKANGQFYIF